MVTFTFNKDEIENIFEKADTVLLNISNVITVNYKDFDCASFKVNNKDLLTRLGGHSIVYCIWVGTSIETYTPVYIGHSASKTAKQRIIAHFGKKHKATGAQLDKIKAELLSRKFVGLSFIKIEPSYMRKSLEEWLIIKHTIKLLWNRNGKSGSLSYIQIEKKGKDNLL